jgi:endonuclease
LGVVGRVELVSDPEPTEALSWLDAQLQGSVVRGRTILVVGSCRIQYKGRAESVLGHGDRVVLVKGDGTLLVHNPSGVKPVNWQPAGAVFAVEMDGEKVVLTAQRRRPPEIVRIAFTEVRLLMASELRDEASFELSGSEGDLRDTLLKNPGLLEEGFRPWARERVSERGPMDLYGEDAMGRRVVVELKRTRAGIAEATQLWRYVEKERAKRGVQVRGILAAPAFSKRCLLMLKEHDLEQRVVKWEQVRPAAQVAAAAQKTLGIFQKSNRQA